jgi:predicted transcriptional regulator of viral defense system
MKLSEQSHLVITKYNGLISAKQAVHDGLASYTSLSRMEREGLLERVGPGIYADPSEFEDSFAIAQLRLSRGIFFKETALYLYDLTDTTPNALEMNFPQGANSNQEALSSLNVISYHQVEHLYKLGITKVKTPNGNTVKAYNMERTLCDIIRPPHIAQDEIIRNAMRDYVNRRGKNVPRLMAYARQLKVEKRMRTYMGVLL